MKIYKFIINKLSSEVFMYLIFGLLTTVLNIFVYYVCNILFEISVGFSTTIAFIISVLFAYVTNKIWVFKSNKKNIIDISNEIIKFFLSRIFTYFVDLLLMLLFVNKLGYNSLICKIFVSVLVIVLNYIFSKILVFNKNK